MEQPLKVIPSLSPGLAIWIILFLVTGIQGEAELKYQIEEEKPTGTFVGAIIADANLETWYSDEELPKLSFDFLRPNSNFTIDSESGVIRTGRKLDRDEICPGEEVCEVRIDVAIQPVEYFKIIKITVRILDKNDHAPTFPEDEIFHEMRESAPVGRSSFVVPVATDPDSPKNSIKEYELVGDEGMFELEVLKKFDGSVQLKVILRKQLDREVRESYDLEIVAKDGGEPAKFGSVIIHLTVLDTNDNSPEFEKSVYEVYIDENVPPRTTVVQVRAEDQDDGLNGKVLYSFNSLTEANYGHLFGIDGTTGEIFVKGVIDFETTQAFTLGVEAWDQGADAIPGEAGVMVHVRDVNDHAPKISVNTLSSPEPGVAVVQENAATGTFVAYITVVDEDTGLNALFNCSLDDSHFELQHRSEGEYQILTAAVLDREKQDMYNLALRCRDRGTEPQVSVEHIPVNVVDVNDHSPVFSQPSYAAELYENNYIGAIILRVNATDRDIGKNSRIQYTIPGTSGNYFEVDSSTGDLKARVPLDREDIDVHRFMVEAHDGGSPPLTASVPVEVIVLDVNDQKPTFNDEGYSFGVPENDPVGSLVGVVTAEDRDGSPPYNEFTYSILPSHTSTNTFAIDRHTGRITNTKVLDREAQSVYYLLVCASDRGVPPLTSSASVTIHVSDRNDNPPVFEYPKLNNNTITISNQVKEGYLVTRVRAFDLDIGINAKLNFRFKKFGTDQDLFEMDPDRGTIIVNKDLAHIENEVFQFSIEVRDSGEPPLSAFANLNIIVNKSVALPYDAQNESVLSGHNLIIVISLACVSGVITIILVVAIVMIRRQDRHKPTAKYNCRMEALKMLSAKEALAKDQESDGSDFGRMGGTLPNGKVVSPMGTCERHRKEVSFNVDGVDDGIDLSSPGHEKSQQSWPSTIDGNSLQHPQAHSSAIMAANLHSPSSGVPMNHPPRANSAHPQHPPWTNHLSQKDMEVHQLLQLLKQDQDASSLQSAEGSATDSGRGPSEEGENGHPPGSRPSDNHSRSTAHSPNQPTSPYNLHTNNNNNSCHSDHSLSNQVVPDPSLNTTAGSCHSYSSNKPRILQTFKDPSPRHPNPNSSNTSLLGGSQVDSSDIISDLGSVHNVCISPTPSMVLSGNHDNACYSNHRPQKMPAPPGSNYHGSSVLSCNSSGEESETGPVIQYSCADMTDDALGKSTYAYHSPCTVDDELNTTTSGSYSVDPQDLCDEIDELFFKDMGL